MKCLSIIFVLFIIFSSSIGIVDDINNNVKSTEIEVEDPYEHNPLVIGIIIAIIFISAVIVIFAIVLLFKKLIYSREPKEVRICPHCFEKMVLKKKELVCRKCDQPGVRI